MIFRDTDVDVQVSLDLGFGDASDPGGCYEFLQYFMIEALGVRLKESYDLESGLQAEYYGEAVADALLACVVTANTDSSGIVPYYQYPEVAAVATIGTRSVVDAGRLCEHLYRQEPMLRLAMWRVDIVTSDHTVRQVVSPRADGGGWPAWTVGAPPSSGPATSWRCELAVSADGARPETAQVLDDLARGAWSRDGDHGAARDALPPGLAVEVTASEPGTARARLTWAAASVIELGWLAAMLERRGLHVDAYGFHELVAADGTTHSLVGSGAPVLAIGGHPTPGFEYITDAEPA